MYLRLALSLQRRLHCLHCSERAPMEPSALRHGKLQANAHSEAEKSRGRGLGSSQGCTGLRLPWRQAHEAGNRVSLLGRGWVLSRARARRVRSDRWLLVSQPGGDVVWLVRAQSWLPADDGSDTLLADLLLLLLLLLSLLLASGCRGLRGSSNATQDAASPFTCDSHLMLRQRPRQRRWRVRRFRSHRLGRRFRRRKAWRLALCWH